MFRQCSILLPASWWSQVYSGKAASWALAAALAANQSQNSASLATRLNRARCYLATPVEIKAIQCLVVAYSEVYCYFTRSANRYSSSTTITRRIRAKVRLAIEVTTTTANTRTTRVMIESIIPPFVSDFSFALPLTLTLVSSTKFCS